MTNASPLVLPGRGTRLVATAVDLVLTSVTFIVIESIFVFAVLSAGKGTLSPLANALVPWSLLLPGLFIGLQMFLLARDGQTIGKKLLRIKIVTVRTQEHGGFVRNVLLRLLVKQQLILFPVLGLLSYLFMAYWLTGRFDGPTVPIIRMDLGAMIVELTILAVMVDVLFIFRGDRRRLHDMIAGTVVVKASSSET